MQQASAAPYDIWFPNLGIGFKNVPRAAFSLFGLEIYWYAICIVTGIIAALLLVQRYAVKTGQKKDDYLDLLTLGLITSFIGLRLYYVAFAWEQYKDNLLDILNFRKGGLAIYGGIIGAFIAGIIISKVKKIPFSTICDSCAPSLLLGQAIGRWGNFFNREAFGGFTNNLFAMRLLPEQVMAAGVTQSHLDNAVVYEGVTYIQVHPAFLYESFFNLIWMFVLIFYRPNKKFAGEVMLLYMLGYGVIRFFVEGLRTDQLLLWGTNIAVSQVMSLVFIVFAVVMIVLGRIREKRKLV